MKGWQKMRCWFWYMVDGGRKRVSLRRGMVDVVGDGEIPRVEGVFFLHSFEYFFCYPGMRRSGINGQGFFFGFGMGIIVSVWL